MRQPSIQMYCFRLYMPTVKKTITAIRILTSTQRAMMPKPKNLYRDDKLNITAGGGGIMTETLPAFLLLHPPPAAPKSITPLTQTQYLAYLYSNYQLFNNLTVTAGLSFDHYRDVDTLSGNINANLNETQPEIWLLWKATDYLSFRLAGFKSVKSAIIAKYVATHTSCRIQPIFWTILMVRQRGNMAWAWIRTFLTIFMPGLKRTSEI